MKINRLVFHRIRGLLGPLFQPVGGRVLVHTPGNFIGLGGSGIRLSGEVLDANTVRLTFCRGSESGGAKLDCWEADPGMSGLAYNPAIPAWEWDGDYNGCDGCGLRLDALAPVTFSASTDVTVEFEVFGTPDTFDGALTAVLSGAGPYSQQLYYDPDLSAWTEDFVSKPYPPAGVYSATFTVPSGQGVSDLSIYAGQLLGGVSPLKDRPISVYSISVPTCGGMCPQCVDITAATGIQVNIAGGGWEEVAAVASGSGAVWEFTTTTAIAEGDAVEWQYFGGEDSIVDCVESLDVGALGPKSLLNGLETTAPTLESVEVGTVADNVFVLVFSEDIVSADFAIGWSIEADATPLTIESATEGPAGTIQITTTESVYEGQVTTISYDAGTGDITDVSGYPDLNTLASITDAAVTNNSTTSGAPTLVSIAITPDATTIVEGATQQFTATGTYSDASTADITATVTWDSSNDALATITAGGLGTGVAYGQATISATLGAVSDTTTLDVWSPAALYATEEGYWYDPSDFSTLWQVSDGTSQVTATGQTVARMTDKAGNGWFITQATEANEPLITQDANNKYCLRFDGITDYMSRGAGPVGTEWTIIVGLKRDTDATTAAGVWGVRVSSTDRMGLGFYSALCAIGYTGTTPRSKSVANPSANPTVVSGQIVEEVSTVGYKDRVELTGTTATVALGSAGIFLGAASAAASFFKGNIYGIIVRAGILSAQDLARAEAWMAVKAGVTL